MIEGKAGAIAKGYYRTRRDVGRMIRGKEMHRPCAECEHLNYFAGCECEARGCRCEDYRYRLRAGQYNGYIPDLFGGC